MWLSPATMNNPSTSSLMTTRMLFVRALSRTPMRSSHVIRPTIMNAGMLTRIGTPAIRGALSSSPCTAGSGDAPRRIRLTGGGRADRAKDAGADDRADREHDEIARAEHALERLRGFELADQKLRDRLPLKELPHEIPCLRFAA